MGTGRHRWIAGEPGEQTLILAFDAPQTIRHILLEVEKPEVPRTQELQLSLSCEGGKTYRELLQQEYNFSPPSTAFEREDWAVMADSVTHLRLVIKPAKGDKPCAWQPSRRWSCGERAREVDQGHRILSSILFDQVAVADSADLHKCDETIRG